MGRAALQETRRILYGGDGGSALGTALALGLDGPLQLVGELVLLALVHDADSVREFAARCSGALRARAGDGDQELADEIDTALGTAAAPDDRLPELAVDLEQLADLIDAGQGSAGGRLDLTTGEVWPESAFEDTVTEDDDEDPDRWLHVWPEGSRRAYQDMVDFTGTRHGARLITALELALDGRGAFHRFKRVLLDWPEDCDDWFVFSEDRSRGRGREWLADAGYRPAVRRGSLPSA